MSNDVSLGLAHEAEVMLRKVGATRENFWVPISKDEELARRVVEFVNPASVRIIVSPDTPFEYHAGWELVSDVEVQAGELKLELAEFLREGESYVSGDELTKRAKEMGANYGQRHAEALFRVQKQIPKEWHWYYLVFPGTVRRDKYGDLCVLCLYWSDDRWFPNFERLVSGFPPHARLVRARKSA